MPEGTRTQAGDTTPPTVTLRSPSPGATGVSAAVNVRAVFSEDIQPATVVMQLRNASNQLVPSQVTYDATTRTATLDPDVDLAGNTQHTVTVSGARDLAGNVMASISWTFTTAASQFVDDVLPQTGLTQPTVIEFASDGRLFVAQKDGRVWVYDSLTDATPTLVADLRVNVYNFWDRGLLGMALHPQFPDVPLLYVLYTYDAVPGGAAPRWGVPPYTNDGCPTPPGATGNGCVVTGRLARLNIGNPALWPLDHTDEDPLITEWPQQFPSHSIGSLVFGPDGALYVSGGDGASFNFADWGQTSLSPSLGDPPNEGGALRSQDLRTSGDPVTLDGTIIRIDHETGAALPDNPRFSTDPDPNGKRIVAYGLRNPFRMTMRPGTRELWIGDVGWSNREEINRLVDPIDGTVDNFGWPCYEGTSRQSGYDAANLPICENLYAAGSSAVVQPYFDYSHSASLLGCAAGSSSISGLAFYPAGGEYPDSFQNALFFADYSRGCIWAMKAGTDGLPNRTNIVHVQQNSAGPVNLVLGPDQTIYYPGFNDGRLHRLRFAGNLPPKAKISANMTGGGAPLTVQFSAADSSDPEGGTLTYRWDLDGDGEFDDGTSETAQWTYTSGGIVIARLTVTDQAGLSDVAAVSILVNTSAPVPVIDSPSPSLTWRVGDVINFAGHATDSDQPGGLPASALVWELIIHHCPSNCHTHSIQTFSGVASGSFVAPDHEYPSFLELRLTATDATGLQSATSIELHPKTVTLTFTSVPPGLEISVNAAAETTPFNRTVIEGSSNSVSAPAQQLLAGTVYQFTSWSDGLGANHNIVASASATYTATYVPGTTNPNLIAAYSMNQGSGNSLNDDSGGGHTGTIAGATWTPSGRFGGALSFDGVNDMVTIPDAADLDLTTGMTLEAWVFPTTTTGIRDVIIKEGSNVDIYNLYARNWRDRPEANGFIGGTNRTAEGTPLPANTWTHLAATYDGAVLRLFVNGTQAASLNIAGAIAVSNGPLRIGGNNLWGEFFQGRIDEVRIYNRALSAAEIQTDMNTPISGVDASPPVLSNGAPSGVLPAGTTSTTLSVSTNENATCRYATSAGVSYASMPFTFATTGGTSHTTPVSALANGTSYSFYVRCADGAGNATTTDFVIGFSVAAPDSVPPTVSMTAPPNGSTVSGNVAVSANASDNVGIVGVQFLLNGAPLGPEDTSAPYSVVWNTTSVANGGPYALSARARDLAGNQTTATAVNVTVNNTAVPNLIAAYNFNEGAGMTLTDRTGRGHTGTISGAAWTPSGRFGGALSFDGVNDMVTIPDAADLDLMTGMTLEAWVFPTTTTGIRDVIIKEGSNVDIYNLYARNWRDRPEANGFIGGTNRTAEGSPLPANTWTHLAATYDGAVLRLFVNGTQAASLNIAGAIAVSNGPLRIGGNSLWGEFFQGRIDEVRIYNRALSAAEIQADMNAAIP